MDAEIVITTIADSLRDRPSVRALVLSGSFGNGRADAYSDVDFVLVASEGPTDEIAELWRGAVERTGEIVLWWDRKSRPALINAITADWTRTDVVILKPEQIEMHTQASLRPLFDHDDLYDGLRQEASHAPISAARLRHQTEEFIRVLGLLHLAVGREEYINGVVGVFHLLSKLIDLLIEETAAPDRGGVLHLNRLLTDEQKQLVTDLPPPVAERDAMIDAHVAYARAYLPRACRYADARGVEWPERFEAATWEKLQWAVGVDRPYDARDVGVSWPQFKDAIFRHVRRATTPA